MKIQLIAQPCCGTLITGITKACLCFTKCSELLRRSYPNKFQSYPHPQHHPFALRWFLQAARSSQKRVPLCWILSPLQPIVARRSLPRLPFWVSRWPSSTGSCSKAAWNSIGSSAPSSSAWVCLPPAFSRNSHPVAGSSITETSNLTTRRVWPTQRARRLRRCPCYYPEPKFVKGYPND